VYTDIRGLKVKVKKGKDNNLDFSVAISSYVSETTSALIIAHYDDTPF